MSEWGNFFFAQVGASAALAGLVFVGVSINLKRILEHALLPDRALEAIVVLVQVLVASSFMLVPHQPPVLLGCEILLTSGIAWYTVLFLSIRAYRAPPRQYHVNQTIYLLLGQIATLPIFIAGAFLLTGSTSGLACMVPGSVASYIMAVFNAWMLMIEINR